MVANQQSPLVAFEKETVLVNGQATVKFQQFAFNDYFNLRLDIDDSELISAVNNVLNVNLPMSVGQLVNSDGFTIYWLGPDEWLIRVTSEEAKPIINSLSDVVADHFSSLVDNSSGMTAIQVSGSNAGYVLKQGMTFDIHPRAFGQGQCAQTVLAKTNVLISCDEIGDEPIYTVIIRRSFSDYAMAFLVDAAATCGYQLEI